jgi:hypothetical protein
MDPKVAAVLALFADDANAKAALLAALGLPMPADQVKADAGKAPPPTHRAHNVRCRGCGRFDWIPLDADPSSVPTYSSKPGPKPVPGPSENHAASKLTTPQIAALGLRNGDEAPATPSAS